MKEFFIDVAFKGGITLAIYFYVIASALQSWLLKFNLHLDFLYLGLIGTVISNLIALYFFVRESKEEKVVISKKSVLVGFLELVIGPLLTMVFMSFFFDKEITQMTAVMAIGFGAFWEIAWSLFKKRFSSVIGNKGDVGNPFGKDRPNDGPR